MRLLRVRKGGKYVPRIALRERVAVALQRVTTARTDDAIADAVDGITISVPMAKRARSLVPVLLRDRSPVIRQAGVQLALRFRHDSREVRKLAEGARDKSRSSGERAADLWVLVYMKARKVASTIVNECIEALEAEDLELRDAAARCLACTRKGRAARALVSRLERESDLLVTIAILDSLRYLHRTLWQPAYIVEAVQVKIAAMGEDGSLVREIFFTSEKVG